MISDTCQSIPEHLAWRVEALQHAVLTKISGSQFVQILNGTHISASSLRRPTAHPAWLSAQLSKLKIQVLDVVTYLTLMRSRIAYAPQVWCTQTTTVYMELERIQRRATKFVLAPPFQIENSYKTRLAILCTLYNLCTNVGLFPSNVECISSISTHNSISSLNGSIHNVD